MFRIAIFYREKQIRAPRRLEGIPRASTREIAVNFPLHIASKSTF